MIKIHEHCVWSINLGLLRKMSEKTKSFYFLISQWYLKTWSKSAHWLPKYNICGKNMFYFIWCLFYSKTMANIKKRLSAKWFYFWFYACVSNFVQFYQLDEKLQTFDTFPALPSPRFGKSGRIDIINKLQKIKLLRNTQARRIWYRPMAC